jgi:Flp pilus assembly protein CpaB
VVAFAGLLGGVLTLAALRADAHQVRVLVAAHDLQVGATLTRADVRSVAVRGDLSALSASLLDRAHGGGVGEIVTAPVRRGDPLRRSDLAEPAVAGGARAMSFAVDAADAVDGNLNAGDHIDVVAIAHDGHEAGYVLVDAPVLAASSPHSSGPLHTNDDRVLLTVSVAGDDALRLAGALNGARVLVVKSTGARSLDAVARYPLVGSGGASGG